MILTKRFAALALTVAVAVSAAGCTRRGSAGAVHQSLVVGQLAEPQSLNPLLLEGVETELVVPTIFSYFVTVNERGDVVPELATEVPSLANGGISRDGLTITYRLRKGVRWQDGTPLTAADFAFTYSAVMNPRNNVQSRTGFDVVQSVTAVDATTLRVRLKRRYSPIITYFFGPDQNYPVLPEHLLKRYGELNTIPFNTAPVGSGPYRFASWTRADNLQLKASAQFFRSAPHIPKLEIKFIPDGNTLLEQLRTHEVDAIFDADPAYLQQYAAIPGTVLTRTPIFGTAALFFNTQDPAMSDVRVRRAITEAIDIPRLVHDATRGAESSAQAGAAFFTWAYDPSVAWPKYDLADAQALLDAAGWRTGAGGMRHRGGVPLVIHFIFEGGDAQSEQTGVLLQQELHSVGISVVLRSYSPVEYMAPAASGGPIFSGRFQMAFLPFLTGVDPNQLAILGCDQIPPQGFNISRFCDPVVQKAYEADAQTYDRAARLRYLETVQRRLAQTLPFVPIWRRHAISVYPQWLQGVKPSPISPYWNVADWSIRGQ